MIKLFVNDVYTNFAGFNEIACLAKKNRNHFLKSIEWDFSTCSFFEANMAAPLYVVVSQTRDELNEILITNLNPQLEIILKKNKFLTHFQKEPLIDNNLTTIPFKIFKSQASEAFSDYLECYMRGKGIPTMSTRLTKQFRKNLLEIFQNAATHSGASQIFTCGQFFPQKNRLDFTIADGGVGIRDKVRAYTGRRVTSIEAIKWSLIEGNTTRTGSHPGGLGLKLLKKFIELNEGKLQIVSRYGYYELTPTGENYTQLDSDFLGTCINIEINTMDKAVYYLKSELSSENIF